MSRKLAEKQLGFVGISAEDNLRMIEPTAPGTQMSHTSSNKMYSLGNKIRTKNNLSAPKKKKQTTKKYEKPKTILAF